MVERKKNGRLGDAVWASMRDEYVTGNESYAEIAARYGVGKTAVERHALNREANDGRTWAEMRETFHDEVNRRTADQTATSVALELAKVREKAARVARKALEKLDERLDTTMEDKDLIAAAKLATTVKVELANDPEFPVTLKAKLDALTIDDLKKLSGDT